MIAPEEASRTKSGLRRTSREKKEPADKEKKRKGREKRAKTERKSEERTKAEERKSRKSRQINRQKPLTSVGGFCIFLIRFVFVFQILVIILFKK